MDQKKETVTLSKGLKTNLALSVALLLIGLFAYWYDLKSKPQREMTEENRKKLYPIDDKHEIEKLTINYKDKDKTSLVTIACKRNCKLSDANAKWEITDPISFPADEGNVSAFITGVTSAVVNETIPLEGEPEEFLKKFGLGGEKRKEREVSITFKDMKESLRIYFGDDTSMEDNVYAYLEEPSTGPQKEQIKVRMVPIHTKNNLTRHLSYWRSKKLFDFAASQADRLSLTNSSGTVKLEKQGTDWFFSGKNERADNELIDTFLTGLVYTNAVEFVSDDKAKDRSKLKIGNSAKYSVTVGVAAPKEKTTEKTTEKQDTKPHQITFDIYEGAKSGKDERTAKIYGTVSDRNYIVELDRVASEKFTKKRDDFKYKYLISNEDRVNVKHIEVKYPKSKAHSYKFEDEKFNETFNNIKKMKIVEFGGEKNFKINLSSWELKSNEGKILASFIIYTDKDKDGDLFVKISDGRSGKLEKSTASALSKEEPKKEAK